MSRFPGSRSGFLSQALALPALALALASAGCVDIISATTARYTDTEERRFPVAGRPDVSLSTFDGGINVRTWDRPEVLVVVERRSTLRTTLKDIEITTRQDGDRVVVEVRSVRSGFELGGRSAFLTVSMPAAGNVTAHTGDGSIDLAGISGRFDLKTGDGRISAEALTGDLTAQTGDGSIRLHDVNGTLNIQTADGPVVANGRFMGLRARSGDGSVSIHADSGSVAEREWDISTSDGPVTLELPESFNADLEAHTGDGRIHINDLRLRDGSQDRARRTVRGRLGEGGGAVRVRSGDGSITIQRF